MTTRRRHPHSQRARTPGRRSVPALYGSLTTGLVTAVIVVASVVAPASPPSIAELGPSAQDRIEEARADQGIGSGDGVGGNCAPDDVGCVESSANDPGAGTGSDSGIPPSLQVAAGRRCFADPPRQTEDPHSPPCVFEIFTGDSGGATAPGVTGAEIRVAIALTSGGEEFKKSITTALAAHFNLRYEFYGRRLTPVFVPIGPLSDPSANSAAAEDLIAAKPFAVASYFQWATNAMLYRRLAEERVISVVSQAPAFNSSEVTEGFTWLVDPPLDVRLRAAGSFVCRAFNDRPARHAGPEFQDSSRRFAIVVRTEPSGVRLDPGPLVDTLTSCDAEFDVFDLPTNASEDQRKTLMLNLRTGGFTTVLPVGPAIDPALYQAATQAGYFPEWMDLGVRGVHVEAWWSQGTAASTTAGQQNQAFGFTPEVRVRPKAEEPAMWAVREGDPTADAGPYTAEAELMYQALLVVASGVQAAGPNLTPERFAQALRATQFPNPNPGAPPYWQQRIGFGPGDPVFHDDYAIWWWNENAPSQTSTQSGRGSFCYLGGGARFTGDAFPVNADERLFSASESCR